MKAFARIFPLTAALLLVACGDEVTQINQTGLEVYSAEKDLPKCTGDNEGEMVLVKGETSVRVCIDGGWFSTAVGEASNAEFACSTEELADGSGLKIICNGDSIGVVYNGAQGEAGKDGKDGDDGKDGEDGKDAKVDTLEADPEREAISLDSLVGVTQKGPFLKGSTVYLYELSDGRTLKQTNGNFTSNITEDNGHYKFSARDLVSQYAMVVVDGYYRNEVTGKTSTAPIRLKALTDMRKRSSVNVNILTHLEFERVYHLVTRGDSTGKKLSVKKAKHQAQKEILKQFYIELGDSTDAEDMDVFGSSDADAALLAISILLQANRTEAELMAVLALLSTDMAETGMWNSERSKLIKAQMADWALDSSIVLSKFRTNVSDWHLGNSVPDFEKFVLSYVAQESGLGPCNSSSVSVGEVKNVTNPLSVYYAQEYSDISSAGKRIRFICTDDAEAGWRFATNIEKDTASWGAGTDGEVRPGRVNGEFHYIYESAKNEWRMATDKERDVYGKECSEFGQITHGSVTTLYAYFCYGNKWKRFYGNEEKEYGKLVDERDGQIYLTIDIGDQTVMAENLNYEYKLWNEETGDSVTYTSFKWVDTVSGELYGRYYSWAVAMDSAGRFTDGSVGCGDGVTCTVAEHARGICPAGWHVPTKAEWETLYAAAGNNPSAVQAITYIINYHNWNGGNNRFLWPDATNSSGLSLLPSGYNQVAEYENFANIDYEGFFWSATKYDERDAWGLVVGDGSAYLKKDGKYRGFAVRCIKDE